jgi:membrane-associated phospholipid phosphatase
MTRLAARQSALLSVLFLAVYGGCNWMTAQRTDVGVWYFDWERHLPFWPLLIVPYLSIDAFFVAAPFLCRTRQELRVYSWRIIAAIVIAGICFAAMPLRFAFDRPATGGGLGWLIETFAAFDRPFNLFPSLHITLAVILADTWRRHTAGIARGVLTTWFVLIGASTVFTYQHHVIDVAGGLMLATLVFYLVREPAMRPAGARNLRVAAGYLFGATTATAIGAALWPAGSVLLWPALSLYIAGVAYAGIGPWIFGKVDGRLPLSWASARRWPGTAASAAPGTSWHLTSGWGDNSASARPRTRCRRVSRLSWISRPISIGRAPSEESRISTCKRSISPRRRSCRWIQPSGSSPATPAGAWSSCTARSATREVPLRSVRICCQADGPGRSTRRSR